MTTFKNVMAIASHLQHLESSLSTILIEAALKLTSLTESSLFILIDGPNGRKYAGTDRLTDAFKEEGLMHENGDTEINIDPSINIDDATGVPKVEKVASVLPSVESSDSATGETKDSDGCGLNEGEGGGGDGGSTNGEHTPPVEGSSSRKRTQPRLWSADGGSSSHKARRLSMEAHNSGEGPDFDFYAVKMESSSVEVYCHSEMGNPPVEDTGNAGNSSSDSRWKKLPGELPPNDDLHEDESRFSDISETSFEDPLEGASLEESAIEESAFDESAFDEPSNYFEVRKVFRYLYD